MNEGKNKFLLISISLIVVAAIAIIAYIIINNKLIDESKNSTKITNLESYLTSKVERYGSIDNYISEFARYLPTDYSDKEISSIIGWYIYYNGENEIDKRKASITEVNDFLDNMFDLKNVNIEEENNFSLIQNNNYYEISIEPTVSEKYRYISYEIKNNQVLIKTISLNETTLDALTINKIFTYEFDGNHLIFVKEDNYK